MIRAAALAAALVPAIAAMAEEADVNDYTSCAAISRHFEMCPDGTAWVLVDWEQFGDGATGHLGVLTFDYAEDWAGRAGNENTPTVEAALDAILSIESEREVSVPHLRDSFATEGLSVARFVETITFGDDEPQLRATMVAQGAGGARVMLMLNAPEDFPLNEMDRRARELAGTVRQMADE